MRLARASKPLIALFLCWAVPPVSAQGGSPIHTLFVRSADANAGSIALQKRLVDRINKGGSVRAVADENSADAVLKVKALVWPVGNYAPNPRSKVVVASEYKGFASAELTGRDAQPLWSYLATPDRFYRAGVVDDLAATLQANLLIALKKGISVAPGLSSNSAAQVAIRAAGATFPEPLYRKWFESYAGVSAGTAISYEAIGSVAGLEAFTQDKVDLAASDIPDADAPGTLLIPTVVGGVVPIFNLQGVDDLYLTPEVLAGIYSGTIRRWNDPRIRASNRRAHLPDAGIQVVHRSDGSGTSLVWTSFLAASSPEWKSKAAAVVDWPVGVPAAGNDGVAAKVQTTANAIGYVELTFAIQHQLSYASVRNPAGEFIHADLAGIVAAAQTVGDTGKSLLNRPGHDTYPIATFTYFLVHPTGGDAKRQAAIAGFLRWMLTAGQKECAGLGYAPLPRAIADRELEAIKAIR